MMERYKPSPKRAQAKALKGQKKLALKGRRDQQNKTKMGQSLNRVYVHIIFSTKHRANLIDKNIENDLYDYLGGICKGMECYPVQIGGYRNHVHLLCLLSKKINITELLENIKKRSSKWIKTKGVQYSNFYWQNGYGIFSVQYSTLDRVIYYIKNQEDHHTKGKVVFKNEFRKLMIENEMEIDERYVWD